MLYSEINLYFTFFNIFNYSDKKSEEKQILKLHYINRQMHFLRLLKNGSLLVFVQHK